jgi:hypothetical protein
MKTKAHNCKRSPPAKDGPGIGQKAPGPAGLGGPARPIFVAVRAPFGLGCFGILIVSLQKFGGIHPQELGET